MPRYAVTLDVGGQRQRIVLENDTPPTEEQALQAYNQYKSQQAQPQAQPQATFGDLRMREDQMPQAQPQQPVQQPSLTPRTDEATAQAPRFQFTPGASPVGGGGAIPTATTTGMELPAGTGAELLRYGGPAAAAMLIPGFGPLAAAGRTALTAYGVPAGVATVAGAALPTAATSAAMGAATGVSEYGAEKMEVAQGLRPEVSTGQVVKSAIVGATPFPIGESLSGPFKAAITGAIKQTAISQVTDALARTFDTAVSEGRFPTAAEISKAALDPLTYLPGAIGGLVGGGAGFAARGPRALTEQEQIGRAGRESAQRLEAVVGEGRAPLTAAQQTGRNLPGEFAPGTGELAAQQRVPRRVRELVTTAPGTGSLQAEQAISAQAAAEAQAMRQQVGATQRAGEQLVEAQLQTSIPGSVRATSTAQNATDSLNAVRNEANRLSQNVTAAYQPYQAEMARLGAENQRFMPTNLQQAVDEVLGSLATVERTTVTPSPIVGGTATTTVTYEPTALFDQATRLAENLQAVSRSPQTVSGLIGLRQQVDNVLNDITEIAPGFRRAQLTRLRQALKADELAAARSVGGNAEALLTRAQGVAENRFQTLERNPIILKALRETSERNAYQNSEQFFSELAAQPEALDSLRTMLAPNEFNQIRRGLFDSMRDINPVNVAGANFENATVLSRNFRNLTPEVRNTIAGSQAQANALQSILDDASRAQTIGGTVPVYRGISEENLNQLFTEAGAVTNPALRARVMGDINDAVARARRYEIDITKQARERAVNPDINPDEFVRNFVLRSNNPAVVRDAIGLLPPATRRDVSRKAAEVFVDHIISSSATARSLDDLIGDRNRLAIVREVMTPNDVRLAQDLMNYQRAVLMTGPQGRLDSSELAKSVWRVTQARALIDLMVGSAPLQNFIAMLSRTPQAIAAIKPTVSAQAAGRGARAVGVPAELMTAYEEARQSLPENRRTAFDQAFQITR